MNDDLFRPEALQARKMQWLGSVQLTTTSLAWPMTLLAIAFLIALVLILSLGSYTRKARVDGRVVPASGMPNVAAPVSGVVTRIVRSEGSKAGRGQPLLEITSAVATPQGSLSRSIARDLEDKQRQLQQDLDNLQRHHVHHSAALKQRIVSLQAKRTAAATRVQLLATESDRAQALLERIQPLQQQQIVSAVQIKSYESIALNAAATLQSARQDLLDTEQELERTGDELDGLPLQTQTQRNQVQRELSDVSTAHSRNQADQHLLLRAPQAGMVSGLAVTVGDTVVPGQRLLSLVPASGPMYAELWIPGRAAGTARIGTPVALRFDAFPHQHYGLRFGRIIQLSANAVPAPEILQRSGVRVDAPAYRALVALDPGSEPLPLRPAMTVNADLLLERRRLYQRIFDPLRSLRPAVAAQTP